ncbi:unnamed protein product [Aspergillus oryzae]|nr:unnamed protein product [Aspergillus oryzae]GMF90684.1 unnamed protein product [Aspergillus oryzae]
MAHGPEGTIYRDEEGFDDTLKIDINFAQMKLIRKLKTSRTSSIFHVNYNGEPRVFKVYLPQPLVMNSVTYSKDRMQKVAIGIQQIHLALIEHNDPYPKNILIVPDDPERFVWIDFDVAIV